MLHRASSSRWGTRDLEGLAACLATDASARLNTPTGQIPPGQRAPAVAHRSTVVQRPGRGGDDCPMISRRKDYFEPLLADIARKWNFETFAWPSVNMTSVITR